MVRLSPFFVCLLLVTLGSLAVAAPIVVAGSEYWQTAPGTTFGGIPFAGVPISPGTLGPTDTIVRRNTDAVLAGVGSSASVPIELVAMQLVSTVPVNFGLGLGTYYVTLQSARGGPATLGQMIIHYTSADDGTPANPEGTFDSFFDIFYDIRFGSVNGPIALSDVLVTTGIGSPWDADPAAGLLIVPGLVGNSAANLHSNKAAGQLDFFPLFDNRHYSNGAQHNLVPAAAAIPEPATTMTLGAGLLMLVGLARRRR